MRTLLVTCLLTGLLSSFSVAAPVYIPDSSQPKLYGEFMIPQLSELEDQWLKRIWLSRTVRTLWKGKELRSGPLFDRWMSMNEEDVVIELIESPNFVNTAVDFSLYYLGRKTSDEAFDWEDSSAIQNLNLFPQVIHLAKMLTENQGDFFDFYSSRLPAYILKLNETPGFTFTDPETGEEVDLSQRSDLERKQYFFEHATKALNKALGLLRAEDFAKQVFCDNAGFNEVSEFASFYGYDVLSILFSSAFENGRQVVFSYCLNPESTTPDMEAFEKVYADFQMFFDELHRFARQELSSDVYDPKSFSEVKINSSGLYKENSVHPMRLSYGPYIENSSTNFNRRRAAYVLDRFFCDDLTPVAIEETGDHTSDKHGTQASCMACHYRLDPMAGFFKTRGFFFLDYEGKPNIQFDDQATVPVEEYSNEWRAPEGSTREWDIGYVRSPSNEELNEYGETLDDLAEILKTAPEVRSCLTKRVLQYTTSSNQTFDGTYIDHVTEVFNQKAEEDSLTAFRDLFATAVLNQTYLNPDRSPTECYDYKPGVDPNSRPPCQVASILEAYCVRCHSYPAGRGGLNLDYWDEIKPGQFGFVHFDEAGEQVDPSDTFASIAERLSSPDPRLRMPRGGGYMDAVDRKDLYVWALEQAEGGQ